MKTKLKGIVQKFPWWPKLSSWQSSLLGSKQFDLHHTGLDLPSFGISVLLTGVLYILMNFWLTRNVDLAYQYSKATEIVSISSADDRVAKLVRVIGGDPRFEKELFLKEAVRSLSEDSSWRDLILATIEGVQNSVPEGFTEVLDSHMTGRRRGMPFLYLTIQPVSGSEMVETFRRISPTWSHKNALIEGDGSQLKAGDIDALLSRLIDRASQENRPQLRSLMRISGWIQWLTFLVMWFVLVLVVKRHILLKNGKLDPTAREGDSAPSVSEVDSDRAQQLAYGTFDFLIGLLPSLGFVGTVLGMGDALLTADGLFSSPDKVQAISVITKHLGFAFDTTLIGLVTGMICGAAVLAQRSWESNQLRKTG
jgi:hypothetical protein